MVNDDDWYYDQEDNYDVDGLDSDIEDDLADFTVYDSEEDMQHGAPGEVKTIKPAIDIEEDLSDTTIISEEDSE